MTIVFIGCNIITPCSFEHVGHILPHFAFRCAISPAIWQQTNQSCFSHFHIVQFLCLINLNTQTVVDNVHFLFITKYVWTDLIHQLIGVNMCEAYEDLTAGTIPEINEQFDVWTKYWFWNIFCQDDEVWKDLDAAKTNQVAGYSRLRWWVTVSMAGMCSSSVAVFHKLVCLKGVEGTQLIWVKIRFCRSCTLRHFQFPRTNN